MCFILTVVVAGGSKDGMTTSHGGCEAGIASSVNAQSSALPEASVDPGTNAGPASGESQRILSTAQQLHHCNNNNTVAERTFDLNDDADPEKF